MKNIKSSHFSILIASFFILFLFNSCKSKLNPFKKTNDTVIVKSDNQLLQDILKSELKYKTLTTKGSLEFQFNNSSKKTAAVFSIYKDSILQASVRPILGVELIRVSFTPDSIIILDRYKKQYVAERFEDSSLAKDIDFNFYNLQAMLTNNIFIPRKKNVLESDLKNFDISSTTDTYILKTKDRNSFSYDFSINVNNRLFSTHVSNKDKNMNLEWNYDQFVTDGVYIYPTLISADVDAMNKHFKINISYSKLEIDKELRINNAIPPSYTKISFNQFLSSYIKR